MRNIASLRNCYSVLSFVVVAVDLNADSKALIATAELAKMQSHAVLVNISRGSVIDEQALISALKAKQVFAASLDVYSERAVKGIGIIPVG